MNQTKWTPLRGYINLKTALALGAIALVGAFVVRLPAQNQSVKAQDCCGASGAQLQTNGNTVQFVPGLPGGKIPLQSGKLAVGNFHSRR